MKEITFYCNVEQEIAAIECEVCDAALIFTPSEDEKMSVTFPKAKNVHTGFGESGLIVKQGKRPLLCGRQKIAIRVPSHLVPSVKIGAVNSEITFEDGIYAELSIRTAKGSLTVSGSSFSDLTVAGDDMEVKLKGCTVKESLNVNISKGDILCEDVFATHLDCHTDCGNVGMANVGVKESALETQSGNITATLTGAAENYSTSILAKNGTSNRDSTTVDGAERNLRAFSDGGNITLEFTDGEADEKPEESIEEAIEEELLPAEEKE